MTDFAYLRPDGVTFEYAILRHSLTAMGDLVTVDVRIRFPSASKDLAARVQKNREVLVSEFTQLAVKIVK